MTASVAGPGLWPYFLLSFAGLIWGITFSLAKIVTVAGAHPLGITFWQGAVGVVVLVFYCLLRKIRLLSSPASIARSTLIALLGTVIPGTLYFYAAKHVPAGILSISIATVPIMTYGASLMIGSDKYQTKRLFGLALGFVGIVLLAHPDASPDANILPWLVLAMIAATCYTLENLYVDNRVPADVDMAALLTVSMFISVLVVGPLLVPFDAFVPLHFPFTKIEYSVIGIALVNTFSYLVFLYLIQNCGAVFASIMGYMVTLSGVAWGIVLFDEQHSLMVWLVLILMMVGMGLVKPIDPPTTH